jgi:Tol biopolymer transport system component
MSASRRGLVAVRSADDVRNQVGLVDRSGHLVRPFGAPGFYSNPTLSPDGRRFVTSVWEDASRKYSLWLFDVDGAGSTRLSLGPVSDLVPVWSPDGRRLIFRSVRDKRAGLYERDLAGGVERVVLASHTAPRMEIPETWSADGRYVTFQVIQHRTRFDVLAWDLAGEPRTFPVLATEANEGQSQISPDGRFIAYVSDESGRFEVYVKPFPSGPEKWLISSHGGYEPRWRQDGQELYYIAADRMLTAVRVATAPVFQAGRATPLFNTHVDYPWQDTRNHYDVMPDGRSFVFLRAANDRRAAPFAMLVNWR